MNSDSVNKFVVILFGVLLSGNALLFNRSLDKLDNMAVTVNKHDVEIAVLREMVAK